MSKKIKIVLTYTYMEDEGEDCNEEMFDNMESDEIEEVVGQESTNEIIASLDTKAMLQLTEKDNDGNDKVIKEREISLWD